jgi:phosphate transport system substrate-binding protein
MRINISEITVKTCLTLLSITLLLQGCGQVSSQDSKPVIIDGSSTVYPITQKIIAEFKQAKAEEKVEIQNNFSGTSGGFEKFCAGATDINAASRPISQLEMKACDQAEVRFIELPIAFDAITIVVNPNNNWAESITIEELKKMWQPEAQGKITQWQQVRNSWPAKPLNLFAPGQDSGTFNYFTEAVMGKVDSSRLDYVFSEDDRALVQGVSQDPNAIGYFGLAYYEQNKDKIKAVAVDNGAGAVMPSAATVESGQYQPLSRPLFIYVNAKAAQDKPALEEFVEFYLEKAPITTKEVGYVPLPDEGYHLGKIHFQRFKIGTVFEGKSEFNLTIGELLRKQAKFK